MGHIKGAHHQKQVEIFKKEYDKHVIYFYMFFTTRQQLAMGGFFYFTSGGLFKQQSMPNIGKLVNVQNSSSMRIFGNVNLLVFFLQNFVLEISYLTGIKWVNTKWKQNLQAEILCFQIIISRKGLDCVFLNNFPFVSNMFLDLKKM